MARWIGEQGRRVGPGPVRAVRGDADDAAAGHRLIIKGWDFNLQLVEQSCGYGVIVALYEI